MQINLYSKYNICTCMLSDISVSAALTVFGGALQVRVGLGVSGVIAQVEQAQGAVEAGHSVARTLTYIHIYDIETGVYRTVSVHMIHIYIANSRCGIKHTSEVLKE